MTQSLRTLLENVIDYAGLFPPAKLDMQNAVREYRWLRSDDASNWILGRFVCPAARIVEMDAEAGDDAFELCVIGSASLEDDLRHVRSLTRGRVAAYEVRYQDGMRVGAIRDALPSIDVFIEVPLDERCDERVAVVSDEGALAKIRTGGVEAAAFPTSRQVSGFIASCAAHGVNFKATAGLHHPLYHRSEEYGVMMHGFLNVFLAAALAAKGNYDMTSLQSLLEVEHGSGIEFTDTGVRVLDYVFSIDDIIAGRRFALSYGSCSVTEPLEDLAAMGQIEAVS